MEVKGLIKSIGQTEKVSDKFTKRNLVLRIEYETKYPQDIIFTFSNKNVDKLDKVSVGEIATVKFNIKGREYNGKYYNTLDGWFISN